MGQTQKFTSLSRACCIENLSGTWWSARADATRAVVSHYKEIRAALLAICTVQDQSLETKVEADGLANKMGPCKDQSILHNE